MKIHLGGSLFIIFAILFTACGLGPASVPMEISASVTPMATYEFHHDPYGRGEIRPSPTKTPTDTPTPTETPTPEITATRTPTFAEMMKNHIVFYLIYPEKGRTDACGDIRVDPIISKRLRSGDKIYDVQVALNMLLGIKTKIYGVWYNALWDSDMTINSVVYKAEKDYILIDFGGHLPAGHLAPCDGHGIREEIWTTIQHYGFKERTLTINGHFLIDELGR